MRIDWRTPLAVLTVLVLGLALLPGPADARPQDGDLVGSGHRMPTRSQPDHWYGARKVGGTTAYCIDLNSGSPREASAWTEYTNYTLHRQTGWGGPRGEHGNGSRKTLVPELAELAWILHETGPSPTADVGAAVEHAVRLRTIDGPRQEEKEAERWAAVTRKHPGTSTEFERLQREAAAFAGPYTLDVSWNRRPNSRNATGELGIRVLSAAGNPVPDRHVSVRGSGDLAVTSTPRTTGPEGSTRVWIQLPVPVAGDVRGTLTVEVSGLPGPRPRLFVPAEKTIQRLVAAPEPLALEWTDEVLLEPEPWRPAVSTRTRDVVATAGAAAVDVVTVTGGRPGAEFSGTSTLLGPFASMPELTAADPDSAPVVGTATFSGSYDADGTAEVHTTQLEFPAPGYYSWRERLDESELVVSPPPPSWPQLPETNVVVSPAVSSELLADGALVPGVTVADTISLEGVSPSREVPGSTSPLLATASGALLGPIAPVQGPDGPVCEAVSWSGAPVLARYEDIAVSGARLDGLLRTRLDEPGCYTATARLRVVWEDEVIADVEHGPGIGSQTVLVEVPPRTPPPTATLPPPPSTTRPQEAPPTEPEPSTSPSPPPSPSPPAASGPPPATQPAPPGTPRINSGEPLDTVRWPLVQVGLVLAAAATATLPRCWGRRR